MVVKRALYPSELYPSELDGQYTVSLRAVRRSSSSSWALLIYV
jgi:hypothetical protein